MAELKLCPFEGGRAYIEYLYVNGQHFYFVVCTRCFAQTGHYLSKQAAIDAWNKRS